MSKPPKAPPHSDIDGVREDKRNPIAASVDAGQNSADLKRAKRESVARPEYDSVEDAKPVDAGESAEARSR